MRVVREHDAAIDTQRHGSAERKPPPSLEPGPPLSRRVALPTNLRSPQARVRLTRPCFEALVPLAAFFEVDVRALDTGIARTHQPLDLATPGDSRDSDFVSLAREGVSLPLAFLGYLPNLRTSHRIL